MLLCEPMPPAAGHRGETNVLSQPASSWTDFCPQPLPSASLVLLLPPSRCFPPAPDFSHPDTEPKNRFECFCRYFCTQPPCLLCSTCVHGNNLHLPLLWGINLVCLQFIFFTAVRPIIIFLKSDFQIKKTSLFMGMGST